MPANFTIKGLASSNNQLLGVWQPAAMPDDAGAASFSTPAAPTAEAVIWSVSLPHDTPSAQQALQAQRDLLQASRQATAQARTKLQQIPPNWLDNAHDVSFGVADNAETHLQNQLAYLTGRSSEDVMFGVTDFMDAETWQHTVAGYQDFMTQLFQLLSPTLLAETRLEEQLQAVSSVSLTGNIKTTWQNKASLTHRQLHQETLNLSLESRLAMLQLAGQISAGAAILAAKFNLPGGQLMALPAAWAYLQDVISQTQTTLAKTQRALAARL